MGVPRFDVIVVGTRVAGASTAMLLARQGLRVLAVDRARFPSDTLSTHQIQVPGVALLNRWGMLDQVVAAGTPATRRIRLDTGDVVVATSATASARVSEQSGSGLRRTSRTRSAKRTDRGGHSWAMPV
jgi:2-polyprenyl-6-methoxyphenol hydroxylase-like FAD-dependent oxidoreductase